MTGDVQNALSMLGNSLDSQTMAINGSFTSRTPENAFYATDNSKTLSCWGYWQDFYYPQVIRESYPVYIRERAQDKGKQAFEIIKILKDKKLIDMKKVGDFVDLMDELIKIL
jgi:hypothetical protein